ncbi:uncharacterized protein ACA1_035290 [Acanthamoeba castellanii str. Neff]|uniref:Uncharacterized protein n=1 Tax=Acanthamoeba castellanii (strain ATCC 30010 / Neff) TaxID=1257118 RepID=L8H9L5_ACACF|nr:uncharacterized protein ACA1_035290 [Acanthamoeba castellanii str. Neff]ELR22199.1 hypothetical protein ACA1_035290 [Acanthamoeba castellanii str. Neff]
MQGATSPALSTGEASISPAKSSSTPLPPAALPPKFRRNRINHCYFYFHFYYYVLFAIAITIAGISRRGR